VRASTSGPSAIVDSAGRTLVRTEPFTAGAISGPVGTHAVITPYCRVGDAFAFGCAAPVAGAAFARARARRRPGA
jgi:apolipoprotein N-acyltransferase